MGAINHFVRDCRPILIHWLRVIHISDDMTQIYINCLIIITNYRFCRCLLWVSKNITIWCGQMCIKTLIRYTGNYNW